MGAGAIASFLSSIVVYNEKGEAHILKPLLYIFQIIGLAIKQIVIVGIAFSGLDIWLLEF